MMTPKYARKAKRPKKNGVASRATPASVVLRFPPDPALNHEKSVVGVLTKRYAVLKSWRAVALELKSNAGTLNKIVSTADDVKPLLPSKKLIARMNEVYGTHLHYIPRAVQVPPCPTCGTVTLSDVCRTCNPPQPKRARKPEDGVVRFARVDAARVAALSALYDQRGIGDARYRVALRRELDDMTG